MPASAGFGTTEQLAERVLSMLEIVPQGLKPKKCGVYGTDQSVPFQNGGEAECSWLCETALVHCTGAEAQPIFCG
jgi:hypothetical protein